MIGVPSARNIISGSTDIVVAVIDTGVDCQHEDLAAKIRRHPAGTGGAG